ncbi:MAG: hypothetical protein AKCLJLPJ_01583 [Fimbriimonadales bacterium]|nr:MAG: hypothetical protein EDM73_07110 [Armatimonadota bacterium]MBV6503511.1 hypothetical protein [Fimbriimonadales bacterium]MCE7900168.1 hypothetical protein [Armatimonadetes bacterium ATM1]MDL1928874.1 hypothetical protein [Fimbriimonadia bacterium ATM]MBC6970694.1 hypothetical protein [Armatimonadota bacterium]
MAALAQAFENYAKPGIVVNYKVAAATTIYKGALVGVNSSGFVVPMNHATANLKFLGFAEETVVNSGADGDKSVRVTKTGSGVYVDPSGIVQADIGKEVYAKTDNEVQISAIGLTNAYKVGTILGLETTSTGVAGVRVRVDNYSV